MGIRDLYQAKASYQLQDWKARIELIRIDYGDEKETITPDQTRVLDHLEICHQFACDRLDELRTTHENRWEMTKQTVEQAMIELKRAIDLAGGGQASRYLEFKPNRAPIYETFFRKG